MPIFTSPCKNKNILFLHIPKCGGSSVEDFFKLNGFTIDFFSPNTKSYIKHFKCTPQHMHSSMLEEIFKLKSFDYIFAIVRNPIKRIISEYLWQVSLPIAQNGIDDWYKKVRKLYKINNFYADNHLRPASEFIIQNTNIFKLEKGLDLAIDSINRCLDLDLQSKDIRNKNSSTKIKEFWIRKMPEIEYRFNQKEPSQYTINRIKEDYLIDFKNFSYDL